MNVATITPRELEAMRLRGSPVDLIDVRTPAEYREVHAEPARLVSLDRLDPRLVMEGRNGDKNTPLYLICRSGTRGKQACEAVPGRRLSQRRQRRGRHPGLGRLACPSSEARRRSPWSDRCESRPGRSVLLGALLGSFVHPAFLGLSAFVGAGLVFAGITDTCGMGHAPGPHALEPGQDAQAEDPCCHRGIPPMKLAHRRRRGGRGIRRRPCPSPVGRRRDRPVRAWPGRLVRQLRPAVLRRRGDRPSGTNCWSRRPSGLRDPLQSGRADPNLGRGDRPRGKDRPRPRSRHRARVRRDLRQAHPRTGCGPAASADSGHRPAGHLHASQPAGRRPHQGSGRPRGQAGRRRRRRISSASNWSKTSFVAASQPR